MAWVSDREVDQYLETALWAETDERQEPLDATYTIHDFSEETRERARAEMEVFRSEADRVLQSLEDDAHPTVDMRDWPYHFWLNRNGHGTGFWDREELYGPAADALAELAERAGERHVVETLEHEGEAVTLEIYG